MFKPSVLCREFNPVLVRLTGLLFLVGLVAGAADKTGKSTLVVPVLSLITIVLWAKRARGSSPTDLWFWILGTGGMAVAFGGYLAMGLGLPATNSVVVLMFLSSYPVMGFSQYALIRGRALGMSVGASLDGVIVSLLSGAVILHCVSGLASHEQFRNLGMASKAYLVFDVLLLGSTINLGSASTGDYLGKSSSPLPRKF